MLGRVRRPALVRPAALLALAAGWFCAPAVLRAGCGDYVVIGPRTAGLSPHQPETTRAPSAPVPDRPRAPCHGPRCSGGSLPPLVPLTAAPDVPEQWGHLVTPRVQAQFGRFLPWAVWDLRRLPGSPPLVYHPPRPGAVSPSLS
jgi:hypothetical protein